MNVLLFYKHLLLLLVISHLLYQVIFIIILDYEYSKEYIDFAMTMCVCLETLLKVEKGFNFSTPISFLIEN